MTIRSMGLAPLLAAGMATLAITVASIADASPTPSVDGGSRGCESSGAGWGVQMDEDRVPGDVEINNSVH
jgi:hypothetical protein